MKFLLLCVLVKNSKSDLRLFVPYVFLFALTTAVSFGRLACTMDNVVFDNALFPLMVDCLLQEDYHRCWYSRYIAVEELFFVLTLFCL